jgi:protein TonB
VAPARIGGVVTKASAEGIRNPEPRYPEVARRRGWQGQVLLRVEVRADGRVGEVIVSKSSGHGILDQAAAGAVQRWRFRPASRGGAAEDSWVELPVKFELRSGR